MKKFGAINILVAMALGLSAFAGKVIFDHDSRIAKLETQRTYIEKSVDEIKKDVQYIRKQFEE